MRLGVIDVGSNTVHVSVVDGTPGGPPLPTFSAKSRVHLAESVDARGVIAEDGIARLSDAVAAASAACREHGVDEVFAFGTASLRGAPNRDQVRDRVAAAAGVPLQLLGGEEEARLTFGAARRWFGWSAGPIVLVDIGGGSLEIASGHLEQPGFAASYPLGAGRTTREWLRDERPSAHQIARLQTHVRETIEDAVTRLRWEGRPAFSVGTSKTFRQLARLAGAPPDRRGQFLRRTLRRSDLKAWVGRLAKMTPKERARLPGVSRQRARQILAGAVVAHTTLKMLDISTLAVCPWALREGVILSRLDAAAPSTASKRQTDLVLEAAGTPGPGPGSLPDGGVRRLRPTASDD